MIKRSDFIKMIGLGSLPIAVQTAYIGSEQSNLNLPKRLQPGDTIGLVAPAGI